MCGRHVCVDVKIIGSHLGSGFSEEGPVGALGTGKYFTQLKIFHKSQLNLTLLTYNVLFIYIFVCFVLYIVFVSFILTVPLTLKIRVNVA